MWRAAKLVLVLGLLATARARHGLSADLSTSTQVAGRGSSVMFPVTFASHGDSVTALQFDIVLDGSVAGLSAVPGESPRGSDKAIYTASLDGGRFRILLAEVDQNIIPGGTVVSLFVNVNPGVTAGTYPIRIESALGADPDGQPFVPGTTNGALVVQSSKGAPVSSEGVLNAASLLPGPLTPGEIITILGSGIGTAGSAQTLVSFDDLASPVLYLGTNQINAVVPLESAAKPTRRWRSPALPVSSRVSWFPWPHPRRRFFR